MAVKKAAPKKVAEPKSAIVYQFADKEYDQASLTKIAKDVWVYDLGKKAADFKSAEIYVKPQESTAYYVINGNVEGSFGI